MPMTVLLAGSILEDVLLSIDVPGVPDVPLDLGDLVEAKCKLEA